MKAQTTIRLTIAATLLAIALTGTLVLSRKGSGLPSAGDDTALALTGLGPRDAEEATLRRAPRSLEGTKVVADNDMPNLEEPDLGPTRPAINDPIEAEPPTNPSDRVRRPKPELATPPSQADNSSAQAQAPQLEPGQELARRIGGRRNNAQTSQGRKPRTTPVSVPAEGSVPKLSRRADMKPGLYGEYFLRNRPIVDDLRQGRNPASGTPTLTRIDSTINFPDRASFKLNVAAEHWLVRWEGFLLVERDRELILALGTDLAGGVSINGQVVLLNDAFHWYTEHLVVLQIPAGFHRLVVEYIEGPSHGDRNGNAACRLMYKPRWGDNVPARPVPAGWLWQPEAVAAAAPVVERLSPTVVDVDAILNIRGQHFLAGAGEQASTSSGALTGKAGGVQVFIDGLAAEITEASDTLIKVKIPPGAGSSDVEVRRRGIPSNRLPVTISTPFGLIVSVWDLRGSALGFVDPEVRAPDLVMIDPEPFPLTLDKFAHVGPGPLALRVEGRYAEWTTFVVVGETQEGGNDSSGPDAASPDSAPRLKLKMRSLWELDWTEAEFRIVAARHEGPPFMQSESPMSTGGMGMGSGSSTPILVSDPTSRGWQKFLCEVVLYPPSMRTEGLSSEFDLKLNVPGDRATTTFFTPGIALPPPPRLMAADSGVAAKVGEELVVLVEASALNASDNPLSFTVDGVPATFVPDTTGQAAGTSRPGGGMTGGMVPVRVTIPDLAGEGKLRARLGLVSSEPLDINVSNRGLVAYYYDFDTPLLAVPNVSSMQPRMVRNDKKLDFENNAAFNLSFPAERFSVEWYGGVRVPTAGEWTFIVQSDDGFRLKINDTVVAEFSGLRPPAESLGSIVLHEGWHDLHLEFYENDVNENLVVSWIAPDGGGTPEKIPTRHLRTERLRGIPLKIAPSGG